MVHETPCDFLARLQPADYAALVAAAQRQRFRRGETVFRAGEPGDHVYFLQQGRVKISQLATIGRDVILWICRTGEVFGLAEVAAGGGRIVNAVACEPSDVLSLTQAQFRAFVLERPQAALLSMQVLSSRMRTLGEMLVNVVTDDVNTRIAKAIQRLSVRHGTRVGNEVRLDLPLTHQEIADMTGTSRQTVTSVLSALKRQGVLSIDSQRIQIESEGLLSEMTQQS